MFLLNFRLSSKNIWMSVCIKTFLVKSLSSWRFYDSSSLDSFCSVNMKGKIGYFLMLLKERPERMFRFRRKWKFEIFAVVQSLTNRLISMSIRLVDLVWIVSYNYWAVYSSLNLISTEVGLEYINISSPVLRWSIEIMCRYLILSKYIEFLIGLVLFKIDLTTSSFWSIFRISKPWKVSNVSIIFIG